MRSRSAFDATPGTPCVVKLFTVFLSIARVLHVGLLANLQYAQPLVWHNLTLQVERTARLHELDLPALEDACSKERAIYEATYRALVKKGIPTMV